MEKGKTFGFTSKRIAQLLAVIADTDDDCPPDASDEYKASLLNEYLQKRFNRSGILMTTMLERNAIAWEMIEHFPDAALLEVVLDDHTPVALLWCRPVW